MAQRTITEEKKDRMLGILDDLQKKMKELDKLRAELRKGKSRIVSPQKSRAMLEEIKVPALELIEE